MKKLLVGLCVVFVGASYADTETINWIVDDSIYTTTTCQSGGNVTLPAQPSKTGYTFVGWEVALYDFSTLDANVGGNSYASNASNRTWSVAFDYGFVSGRSLCSTTGGSYAVAGTPDESGTGETRFCWCKATGYKPAGSSVVHENSSSSSWVFFVDSVSASDCASGCAPNCGYFIQRRSDFRRTLFGITQ